MPAAPYPNPSYWLDDLWSREGHLEYPPLEGPVAADVAIIGGGITGVSLAYWLAREGRRPLLLEARTLAGSASGRNAGFMTASTAEGYATVVERFGRAAARRLWAFSVANGVSVREIVEEHRLRDVGYAPIDAATLAASEDELAAVQRGARLLIEDGWPVELLTKDDLPDGLRRSFLGGALRHGNAEVNPAAFVNALAGIAVSLGAQIREQTPVTGWREADRGVLLSTPAGEVRTGTAVLATNALAPLLAPGLAVTPQRGQVLATQPLGERLCDWLCGANWGYQYWHQLPDTRLVAGGWRNLAFGDEESNATLERPTDTVQAGIDSLLRDVYGLHDPLPVTHRWGGTMGFTPDALPFAGPLPGSTVRYVAAGFTGHGNGMAPQIARLVTDLIQGRPNPDAALFDPGRPLTKDERVAAPFTH
jgi:gamma-glutamylputrescine oxidase